MSVIKEGPGFKARANVLATEALGAQLRILQFLLPLDGWFISRQEGEAWVVLASHGLFESLAAATLDSFLEDGWDAAASIEEFFYRPLTLDESGVVAGNMPGIDGGAHLIMAELLDNNGTYMGRIVGFARRPPASVLTICAPKLKLCVAAMSLTVALHVELGIAEQMVIEMQRDAFIDPLTGVFNRAGWINRLAHIDAHASRSNGDAAIVVLDLDFLKVVNDTKGHAAGDDLLRLTAQTISSVLRSTDSVGRLGGDEFGVVVQNATPVVAASLLNRLKQALAHVDIKISIGMALKSEAGTLKKTMLLADERMYEEKRKKPVPERNRPKPLPAQRQGRSEAS